MSTNDLAPLEVSSLTGHTSSVIEQPSSGLPDGISEWWLRGTAIVIIIITSLTLLNALIAEIALEFASQSFETIELDIGPYPENGTVGEQRQWNETNEAILWMEATQGMFDDPRMQQLLRVQRIGAIISFFVAVVAVLFLFNQDRKGIGFASLWICIGFGVQFYGAFISSILSTEYFGGLYVDELAWLQVAQSYGGYVQMAMCNMSLIGILIIVWTKTKFNSVENISAFHNIPTNSNDFHS